MAEVTRSLLSLTAVSWPVHDKHDHEVRGTHRKALCKQRPDGGHVPFDCGRRGLALKGFDICGNRRDSLDL